MGKRRGTLQRGSWGCTRDHVCGRVGTNQKLERGPKGFLEKKGTSRPEEQMGIESCYGDLGDGQYMGTRMVGGVGAGP